MAGSAGGDLDFSTLSLKDLIEARDLYHFHLMSKANVSARRREGKPAPWFVVPKRLYLPDGRAVPVCTVLAPPVSHPKRRAWSRGTPPASLARRSARLRSGLAPIGAGTDKQADW